MSSRSSSPDPFLANLQAVGIADSLGRRLVLGRQVGAGGMGRVYQATDEASGRVLAIKLIQDVRGEADVARFTAEAEILECLKHDAIVAYVGHGVTADGDPYLAMAWLDGDDLGQRLRRAPLSVADTVALGRRVAGGLAAAHRVGVVHRDLKPSNIVLVDGDVARATLVDFGIARRSGSGGLTRTGELVGTPGYMAPEQVRGRRDLDGRADLFGLGCVLYECLTGRPPFEGDEVMTVLAKLLLEPAPRVSAQVADVPPHLDDLIARLLAKDERQRPASAGEVCAELTAIAEALDGDGPVAVTTPMARPTGDDARVAPPAPRRRRAPAIAAAIAGLLLISAAVVHWMTAREPASHAANRAAAPPPVRCDRDVRDGCAARCQDGDTEACFLEGEGKAFGLGGLPKDVLSGVEILDRTVRSIQYDDARVAAWIESDRAASTDVDWSVSLNARGFRIYEAEKHRAQGGDHIYRRDQIERARRWFKLAYARNASYHRAIWNQACMSALLGDIDQSVAALDDLLGTIPPEERAGYEIKICTDSDFCLIVDDARFQASLRTRVDCAGRRRSCVVGVDRPIAVR